jgi:hypothetical protein
MTTAVIRSFSPDHGLVIVKACSICPQSTL